MHQIHFRQGLCPSPRWISLQRSPDSLIGWERDTPLQSPLYSTAARLKLTCSCLQSIVRPPMSRRLSFKGSEVLD